MPNQEQLTHPIAAYVPTESDHLLCDDTLPLGCQRCGPLHSDSCCDLCTPQRFSELAPAPEKAPGRPRRARMPKSWKQDADDMSFLEMLEDWREQEVVSRWGTAAASTIGGCLILPDPIAERIVYCAHANKLRSKDEFIRQVQWKEAGRYAEQILDMLTRHLACRLRQEPMAAQASSGAKVTKTGAAPRLCGNCRQPGHNIELLLPYSRSISSRCLLQNVHA